MNIISPQIGRNMEQRSKFGIYVNVKDQKVVRINSPYWIPEGADWTYVTPEVNATLLQVREMARDKGMVPDADQLTWGTIPAKD